MRILALSLAFSFFLKGQLFEIKGDVPAPKTLLKSDIEKLPRASVTVDVHGVKTTYQGVNFVDLFKSSGLVFDNAAKPKNLVRYALIEGTDGYRVIFAIPEFDPSLASKTVVLADTSNGQPLTPAEGPYRVIVSDEKRQMRSVKFASSVTVVTLSGAPAGNSASH